MGEAVFPPCILALGQTVLGVNGDLLKKDLSQDAVAPMTVVVSAPASTVGRYQPTPVLEAPGHSQANLAQSLVGSLLPSPGSWCTQGFVCESVSPVLWKFCNQIPLKFKVKVPGDFKSLCWSCWSCWITDG